MVLSKKVETRRKGSGDAEVAKSNKRKEEFKKELDAKIAKRERSKKEKKKLEEEIDAKIILHTSALNKKIKPDRRGRVLFRTDSVNGDSLVLKLEKDKPSHFSRISKKIKTLHNKAKNNFRGIVIISPPSRGIGYFNRRIMNWVGGCRPALTDPGFYIIECYHCGEEFKTKNQQQKYHCRKCKKDEETYQRKLKRQANLRCRECPICHDTYTPKTMKSPTCGKGDCRTTWSRRQNKEKN